MNTQDTIAAIASPPGGALRGIVRLSGPGVVACLEGCFYPDPQYDDAADADSSTAQSLGLRLRPAASAAAMLIEGQLAISPNIRLPCQLYFWPGPRSFTRQSVAELHTLGSPPLLDAALRTLCQAGARLAEPGEFTLRAFLAGRIDLTQAEAVLGVIDARSQRQLDSALRQLAGGLAQPLQNLRSRLMDLLADLEAGLDFVDEDLEFVSNAELVARLAEAAEQLAELDARMIHRDQAPELFRVVLSGWPNTGKSSLLNALVGESAAIVSDSAGTTRDYVIRRVAIGGLDCLLIDTAGVDPAAPEGIAAAAQSLTGQQAAQAHLQLWCIDASRHLNAWERMALEQPASTDRVLVLTKVDQPVCTDLHVPAVATSSRWARGLDELRRVIAQRLAEQSGDESSVVAGTAIRCRESLRRAAEAVGQASRLAAAGTGEEIIAAELRLALDELAQIVGAAYTEDLLDRIFTRFCIGK